MARIVAGCRDATQDWALATQRGWLPAVLCVLLSSSGCLRKSAFPASNGSAPLAEPDNPAPTAAASDSSHPVSAGDGYSLLAINPQVSPYRVVVPEVYVRPGTTYQSNVRICVSTEGRVSSVVILKPSIPIIDDQLPTVIGRWIFRTYVVDGRPTPFCYVMHYNVR